MKNLQLQKLNNKLLEEWGQTLLAKGSVKLSTIGDFEALEVEFVQTKAIVKITQDGKHTNVNTNADLNNDEFLFSIIRTIINLAYDVFIKQEEDEYEAEYEEEENG